LRIAVARFGHYELAVALRAPPALLDAWIHGQATMPERKLLLLADLLEKASETSPHSAQPTSASEKRGPAVKP